MNCTHGWWRKLVWASVLAALVAGAGSAMGATVVVNGRPLVTSRMPLMVGGSMLLPMRDVFEALGAEVKWFAAERQIMAVRGATTVQLTLGSRTALVNNATRQLPVAPMLIGGATYVPLRFPAEAFGGNVDWDGATQTAYIDISDGGGASGSGGNAATGGGTTAPGGATKVEGTLVQIIAATNPSVVLQMTGTDTLRMLRVRPQTVVTRGAGGRQAAVATTADLREGDLVQAIVGDDDSLVSLTATYGEKQGKVFGLAGNTLVFEDGAAFALSGKVTVLAPDGRAVDLSQVKAGVQAAVRYQPASRVVWQIALASASSSSADGQVDIFTIGVTNPGRVFRAGDSITVRLQGTPGGRATFELPGVVSSATEMTEVSSGVYEATVKVPQGLDSTEATLSGNLTRNGVTARRVTGAAPLTVDSTPPTIEDVSPAAGSSLDNASPTVQVLYSDDQGSGIDLYSLVLKLDGRDVTDSANIGATRTSLSTDNLGLGRHEVRVKVADGAGNVAEKTWSFMIVSPATGIIAAMWHDAKQTLVAGDVLTVNMRVVEPGGAATFSLGSWKRDLVMQRVGNTATYRGVYQVQAGDQVDSAPVVARYRSARGEQATMAATTTVTINSMLPTELRITSPETGTKVGERIEVTGVAPPGSTIRITVQYRTRLITSVTGQLWQGTVTANDAGVWTSPAISPDVFLGRADEYTVLVELMNEAGEATARQSIKLTK